MNIGIVAGGTGGHIFPALALASEYYEKNHNIFYFGSENRMEAKYVKETPYSFLAIENDGIRKGFKRNVKAALQQFKAIRVAMKHLKANKIDLVIGFGGFVTFPVCVAAHLLRIPYFLHEQNALAGKANLLVERKARGVCVCYEKAKYAFKNKNVVLLGNPRASIVAKTVKTNRIIDEMNLDLSLPIVYVVMGSLGSRPFYDKLINLVKTYEIKDFQFVISGGTRDIAEYRKSVEGIKNVHFFEFVNQIELLPHCTMVISRSGATSIAEIMASEIPSILIPSPYVSNNHQYYNAKECVDHHAALLLLDEEITSEKLFTMIDSTLKNKELMNQLKEGCSKIAYKQSSTNIINWIQESIQ